jgi:hypothetical protein
VPFCTGAISNRDYAGCSPLPPACSTVTRRAPFPRTRARIKGCVVVITGTRDRSSFRPVGILLAVFAASAAGGFGPGGRAATLVAAPHTTLPLRERPIEAALRQPLRFDALDSQDVGRGGFVSRGNGYALLLERGGAVVSLSGRPQSSSSRAAAAVVRMTWPGANRRVRPAGLEAATGSATT